MLLRKSTPRWDVVDDYEIHGQRCIVARKMAGPTGGLSSCELYAISRRATGLAMKVIAAELRISVSFVSECVTQALRKQGIPVEMELAHPGRLKPGWIVDPL